MIKIITFTLYALSGDGHAYVLDSGLSGSDCTTTIERMAGAPLSDITLTCELERGESPRRTFSR